MGDDNASKLVRLWSVSIQIGNSGSLVRNDIFSNSDVVVPWSRFGVSSQVEALFWIVDVLEKVLDLIVAEVEEDAVLWCLGAELDSGAAFSEASWSHQGLWQRSGNIVSMSTTLTLPDRFDIATVIDVPWEIFVSLWESSGDRSTCKSKCEKVREPSHDAVKISSKKEVVKSGTEAGAVEVVWM